MKMNLRDFSGEEEKQLKSCWGNDVKQDYRKGAVVVLCMGNKMMMSLGVSELPAMLEK